jgi:hypothetical protein
MQRFFDEGSVAFTQVGAGEGHEEGTPQPGCRGAGRRRAPLAFMRPEPASPC